jgi:hypothetical protein
LVAPLARPNEFAGELYVGRTAKNRVWFLCSGFGDVGCSFVVLATGQKYGKFTKNKNQELSLLVFYTTSTARKFKIHLFSTKHIYKT